MSNNSKQITALNNIITTLYDGENGYKEAAEAVDNNLLESKFMFYSRQRYNFGHAIKPFITQLGGEVDKGSSVAAKAHRTWIDFKSSITGSDEAAVLNECVRGEESAVEAYQDVITDENIPAAARKVLRDQLTEITSALNDVRTLANSYATA